MYLPAKAEQKKINEQAYQDIQTFKAMLNSLAVSAEQFKQLQKLLITSEQHTQQIKEQLAND